MDRTIFKEPMLNFPISDLKVNPSFKKVTDQHGFYCLVDLRQTKDPYDLLKGFNMHLLMEHINVVRSYGADCYLK